MLADHPNDTLTDVERTQSEVMYDLPDNIHNRIFLFIGDKSMRLCNQFEQCKTFATGKLVRLDNIKAAIDWLAQTEQDILPAALICDASYSKEELRTLKKIFSKRRQIPLTLYNDHNVAEYRSKAVALPSVTEDFLYEDLGLSNIKERIVFLSELKKLEAIKQVSSMSKDQFMKRNITKRAFDIAIASLCIILISPVLLLITIAIKLESRGPVFFISKRAGAGYRIFDFYKFRTMQSNADQMRDHLRTLNTYYAKDRDLTQKGEPFFFKVKNDPRVTRVGRILRKTSLDELPQLFNVLKGDMSLVGNRPLPLDEGATLTIDHWADRFLAPAGMTGLWQIAKNKDNMSVSERIDLDLEYVKKNSFSLDMQILLKTIPAMLQKE